MGDQPDDGTYEILDLRSALSRRQKDGAEEDSFPRSDLAEPASVVDLNEGADATTGSESLPRWPIWAIMVAAFIAGVAAGGYGWHARTEGFDAGRVDVIALDLHLNGEVRGSVDQFFLFAHLHNAGARDVTILGLRIPGWSKTRDGAAQEVTIRAGESSSMVIYGAPGCEMGVPEELEADVRTEAGASSVLVPLPSTIAVDLLVSRECGQAAGRSSEEGNIHFSWDGAHAIEPPHMALDLDNTIGDVELVGVAITVPGYAAAATNLPLPIKHGTQETLELDWSITDCAATQDLGAVDVELSLAGRAPVTTQLPPWSIAQLARFAAVECGP